MADSPQSTSALPEPASASSASSISSQSSSESEQQPYSASTSRPTSRRSRMNRLPRQKSNTSLIVSKDTDVVQRHRPHYPPDDARAMSPRRNSHDLERLAEGARESLKDQARTLQSSLAALAERIDEVKSDHDRLESENRFLQDYIGGLTRTMSQRDLSSTGHAGASAKKGRR